MASNTRIVGSRIVRRLGSGTDLLAYPPPFRSWLALSNDPDNTTLDGWRELHQLIWVDLALPFADSFFLVSYNDALPDQVSLATNPEILDAHPHDTMHTWGDYTMSISRHFSRSDAEAGLVQLSERRFEPRVWTDHSNFSGNLVHRGSDGAQPRIADASGHSYENFVYTLDLISKAGVRYIWDGGPGGDAVLGQDREIDRQEWYTAIHGEGRKARMIALADATIGPVLRRLQSSFASYGRGNNAQYWQHTFPDGQSFYLFKRYVRWAAADIDGLGSVIAPERIDSLIESGGTCIVYTHLGKQRAERPTCNGHIPPKTRVALEHVSRRYREQRVMLSSTSRLLDYLVLRDRVVLSEGMLDFRADGIRFSDLSAVDLKGFVFGIRTKDEQPPDVTCSGEAIEHSWRELDRGLWKVSIGTERAAGDE